MKHTFITKWSMSGMNYEYQKAVSIGIFRSVLTWSLRALDLICIERKKEVWFQHSLKAQEVAELLSSWRHKATPATSSQCHLTGRVGDLNSSEFKVLKKVFFLRNQLLTKWSNQHAWSYIKKITERLSWRQRRNVEMESVSLVVDLSESTQKIWPLPDNFG